MKKGKGSQLRQYLAVLLILAVLTGLFGLTGCATSKKEPVVLKMADGGWDTFRLHNAVVSYILDKGMGIATEEVTGTTSITWKALVDGDLQIYMETWTDNIPMYAGDKEAGKIKELGVNYDDADQGFYVPRYVIEGDAARGIAPMAPDLKTVKDLLKYPQVFKDPEQPDKGRIYGGIPGWDASDRVLTNKYNAYGLNASYTYFQAGSEAAQIASLIDACEKGKPWVGFYWTPNWTSVQYDVVKLEDDPYVDATSFQNGLTAFPMARITVCVNPVIVSDYPQVADLLSHYKTSSALNSEVLSYMKANNAEPGPAAVWLMKKHPELLTQWITDAKILKKVQDALAKEA